MVQTAVQRYAKSAGATEYLIISFRDRLAVVNEGTVASATSTTAVLDEGASSSDDTYNTYRIRLLKGTGASDGASVAITDYTGTSRTATVAAWQTTPDSTTTYQIVDVITTLTSIVEVTTTALTLASKAITTEITYDPSDPQPVPIGQALEFTCAGGTAGASYTIRATCVTVRGETMEIDCVVDVV